MLTAAHAALIARRLDAWVAALRNVAAARPVATPRVLEVAEADEIARGRDYARALTLAGIDSAEKSRAAGTGHWAGMDGRPER